MILRTFSSQGATQERPARKIAIALSYTTMLWYSIVVYGILLHYAVWTICIMYYTTISTYKFRAHSGPLSLLTVPLLVLLSPVSWVSEEHGRSF